MKFKSFLAGHKTLLKDVITSTCLLGASAGIVFGVSAGMFSIRYMKLSGAEERLQAYKNHAYLSEKISSAWNMNDVKDGETVTIKGYEIPKWQDMRQAFEDHDEVAISWWKGLHGDNNEHLWDKYKDMGMEHEEGDELSSSQIEARYKYTSMVIDGATHSTMDRSFNQSLYEGLADFNHNLKLSKYDPENGGAGKNSCNSYKPSQDNTTDFINTYNAVIKEHDVVGLAGFNHSTPLTTMMTHNGDDPIARNADPEIDKELNSTGLVLLDSNIANNQNIASVQFRADQPGFLTAVAVCQYFYNNLDLYHDNYQELSVAEYGGVAIPTVTIYLGGFQRGIEFFNYTVLSASVTLETMKFWTGEATPSGSHEQALLSTLTNLIDHSKYKDEIINIKDQGAAKIFEKYSQQLYDEFEVKMIKLGDFDAHFSGTFTAGDAIGITKQYLNRGASAIIAVAGPQSLDTAQEIQNQNSKCIVIGVDSAMEDGDYQRYHQGCDESTKLKVNENDKYVDKTVDAEGNHSEQANAIIKFSAIKDIKTVSKKIARLCAEGKNWDINTTPWNHDKTFNWEDKYRLDKNSCVVTKIEDTDTCSIAPIDEYHYTSQLIIPRTIETDDGPLIVKRIDSGFEGKLNDVQGIKFECDPGLEIGTNAFKMGDNANIWFVEFPNFQGSFFGIIHEGGFGNWPTKNAGMMRFGDLVYESQKIETYGDMLSEDGLSEEWGIVAPDAQKSVCGPGFQTCGNIQNGLISISYDGFIPFMQAMKCVPFYTNTGELVSLNDAWSSAVMAYAEECKIKNITVDDAYMTLAQNFNNLLTFTRTDADGNPTPQFSNYNHTMAILGILLDQAKISFTSDMTLVPDGQGGYTTLTGTDPINLSIIDWLDYNMYMMS